MSADVLVLGAGPAGLAVAAALLRGGLDPLVLESADRFGGAVLTHRADGFLAECGPNSLMLEDDGTETFLRQLGLVPLEASATAKKRFLVHRGQPVAAPGNPLAALTTPLLSLRGKLRILGEPFVHSASAEEESVAAFARRRLGREVVERLIDPMIAGIYAGDPGKLSLAQALPRLHAMEQRYGSLLLAGLRKGRAAPRRRLVNFPGGMEEIPEAMARFIGADRLQSGVVLRSIDSTRDGWELVWQAAGKNRRATARALVLATPPWSWGNLPLPSGLQRHLRPWQNMVAPPLSVVSLGFPRDQVAHPLDGFGMLIPAVEQRHILGTLFPSSLFPGRAPAGQVLLTSFVGGCRQPELARQNDTAQISLVREDLRQLLGARGEPSFVHLRHWPRAIPQYNLGYGRLLGLLDSAERDCTGLYFCGNYRAGVALPKTILHATGIARKILDHQRR